MRFPFLRIRRLSSGTEAIESRVLAETLREAHALLAPGKDQYVTSEASYRAGLPRGLRPGYCRSCGQRPMEKAYGHDTGRCGKCQLLVHKEQQVRSVQKRRHEATQLTPAMVAECRRDLQRQLDANTAKKAGRPRTRGPAITVGREAEG